MPGKIEINEFFVEGGDQKKSHVLLHITEPSTPEEENRGYFFAVCELNDSDEDQIERLQDIIDEMEKDIYSLEPKKNQNIFEASLENANRKGHHIINNSENGVNCVVGLIKKGAVSLSHYGTPKVSLLYYGKNGLDQISLIDEKHEKNATQLFASTIEGPLKSGDMLLLTTPKVNEYVPITKIKEILSTKGTADGIKKIQKELNELDNDLSFGGIVFTNGLRIIDSPLVGSAPSSTKVEHTGQKLEPVSVAEESNFRPRQKKQEQNLTNTLLLNIGRAIVGLILSVYKFGKWLITSIWKMVVGLILIITNKAGQRIHVINAGKTRVRAILKKIENLPLLAKLSFVGIIILTAIFVGSIIFEKVKAVQIAKEDEYKVVMQKIIEKKNTAESDAIYGDSEQSLNTLLAIKKDAEALPTSSDKKVQDKNQLMSSIDASLNTLRKIKTVDAEIIAKTAFNQGTSRLAFIDNTLVAYNSNDPKFYLVNPITKTVEIKSHENIPSLINDNTPKENDRIIFLSAKGEITEFDKTSETLQIKNITLEKNSIYKAICTYNQKIYALDPVTNQIYKHSRTQTGYDKAAPWIKSTSSKYNLSQAISLAIDGDLFVLAASGEITKFTNGLRVDFSPKGLDPALNKPTNIWTYNGVKNIYITEPINKRLIVLDKSGKLLAQYTSKDWQAPTGSIIDEAKGVAYVIDGSTIYKIKL